MIDLLRGLKTPVFPVGRLDMDTEGILLLTNDGDAADKLTHPRYGVKKVYRATVRGRMDDDAANKLASGVALKDGMAKAEKITIVSRTKTSTIVKLTIREGRNRIVRRMMEGRGLPRDAADPRAVRAAGACRHRAGEVPPRQRTGGGADSQGARPMRRLAWLLPLVLIPIVFAARYKPDYTDLPELPYRKTRVRLSASQQAAAFGYVREALTASSAGRNAPLPPPSIPDVGPTRVYLATFARGRAPLVASSAEGTVHDCLMQAVRRLAADPAYAAYASDEMPLRLDLVRWRRKLTVPGGRGVEGEGRGGVRRVDRPDAGRAGRPAAVGHPLPRLGRARRRGPRATPAGAAV